MQELKRPKINTNILTRTLLLVIILFSLKSSAAEISQKEYTPQAIFNNMSLAEKVGQLFIIDLARLYNEKNITSLTPTMRQKLQRYNFGGIILFAQNLDNSAQIKKLIKDIRSTERLPMFIAIDEEGGRVSRLQHTRKLHLNHTPSAEDIGKKMNTNYAYNIGKKLAEQLKKFGFNLDFTPVADINTNPKNTVIGARAFGDNPAVVSKMAVAIIKGLQDNKVLATAKHFPGHGDTAIDTHEALAYIHHDLDRLRNEEFIPFQAAINNGVKFIMLAHIATPKITGNNTPATMSKFFIKDILRTEMNFNGIIITDAMMMQAITKHYTAAQASINALSAGVDIILMPDNIDEAYTAVLKKAKADKAFEDVINIAVKRILQIKARLK